MANTVNISTSDGLKEYILNRLGNAAHEVEITDEQLSLCISEALDLFNDYHYDAYEFQFIAQQITQDDLDNGYFIPPDNIYEVIYCLKVSGLSGNVNVVGWPKGLGLPHNFMSMGYGGWVAGGFGTLSGNGYGPGSSSYFLMKTRLADIDFSLYPGSPIRYNRHERKLYLENKNELSLGGYIVYYAKVVSDKVWNNGWLKRYATELCRLQWGINLSKYDNITLPGGATINVDRIIQMAEDKIEKLKEELYENYTEPPQFFIM